jgi:hypothetical protein
MLHLLGDVPNTILACSPYTFAFATAVAGVTFVIKYGTGQVADSARFLKLAFISSVKFTCGVAGGLLLGWCFMEYMKRICYCAPNSFFY